MVISGVVWQKNLDNLIKALSLRSMKKKKVPFSFCLRLHELSSCNLLVLILLTYLELERYELN